MNWGFLEKILSGVNKYSTVIGRIWLSVVFLFRILVYVAAAEQVWKDEQRDFVCNTRQPGCENACFDRSFPVSQVRLWALQLIMVSTPSLLVALHVAYREHRESRLHRKIYADKSSLDGGLFCTYSFSLICKTAFEVGFLLAFYFIYDGFEVPILIRCDESPCPNTVDCYIGKATEKKIFLYIMGTTSILCIVLNVMEFTYILWKRLWKCFTRRYIPTERDPQRDTQRDPQRDTQRDPQRDTQRDPERETQRDPQRETQRDPQRETQRDPQRDTERHPERPTERPTERHPERPTERPTERHRERHRETHRERHRETPTETHRERHRDTERDTERHPERETERDTERPTERHPERDTERPTERDTEDRHLSPKQPPVSIVNSSCTQPTANTA